MTTVVQQQVVVVEEASQRISAVSHGVQGPPGPPGPPGESESQQYDTDLVLIYQTAKL